MDTLIRAAEIWTPDADGYLLEFGDGAYGDGVEFDTVSRALCFGRGEGLPGRVWEERRPILLERLDHRDFRRAKAAANAGYRAAVGLPFEDGGAGDAIVVLFFGEVAAVQCGVELWEIDGATRKSMARLGVPVTRADGRAIDACHLSLPIAVAPDARYELAMSGRPGTPVGHAISRTSSDPIDTPRLRRANDAAPARRGRALRCTLACPIVEAGAMPATVLIEL